MIVLFSYLSQQVFDKSPLVLKKSVAIIPNAQNFSKKEGIVSGWVDFFENNNYTVELIDLKEYQHNKLLDKLLEFEVVHVIGGNSFWLLEIMRKSGFDKILPELLDFGVIYSGESAGSTVMGNSIYPTKYMDDMSLCSINDFSGLHYFDFVFLPHANSQKFISLIVQIENDFSKEFTFKKFNDDQGMIIKINKENNKKEIIYF